MSEGRPQLVALPEASRSSRPPDTRRSRRLLWLLVAVTLLSASGWGLAQRRSGRLERELAATQDELSDTRARIAVLEAERSEVHAQVQALAADATALAGRLAELEGLVSSDHAHATDTQLPPGEPAAAE